MAEREPHPKILELARAIARSMAREEHEKARAASRRKEDPKEVAEKGSVCPTASGSTE